VIVNRSSANGSIEERLSRLTPRQRECLRLVFEGYQSKPIAARLGISHGRVDKHIADARKLLGVTNRGEAARLLAASERTEPAGDEGAQSWGAPSMGLSPTPEIQPPDPADGYGEVQPDGKGRLVTEAQEAYSGRWSQGGFVVSLPLRLGGRQNNDLSFQNMAFAIFAIALVGAGAAGAVFSLLMVLDRFLVEFRPIQF
jgi:DNA-binding CsgD family transcriptional regulator